MRPTRYLSCLLVSLFLVNGSAFAQSSNPSERLKKHINKMVEKVEEAPTPQDKRTILNDSFDDLITAFERVEGMEAISQQDRQAVALLKKNISEKKKELNGMDGYARIKDNRLNQFANFVQQDLEQADDTITISLTVALLIVIILLLL
ncbi:MAG: hypothetical protein R3222_00120 [Balneolaceae bacterium]|nr:hypothetical protein [Balneolaceae bacterium]